MNGFQTFLKKVTDTIGDKFCVERNGYLVGSSVITVSTGGQGIFLRSNKIELIMQALRPPVWRLLSFECAFAPMRI